MQPVKTTKKPVRFDLETKASSASSEIKNKQPKKERLTQAREPSPSSDHGPSRTYPIPPGSESPLPPRVRRHHSSSWLSDPAIPSPPEDEPLAPTKVVKGIRAIAILQKTRSILSNISLGRCKMTLLSRRVKSSPDLQKRYVNSKIR
jgi:hypothetical protein